MFTVVLGNTIVINLIQFILGTMIAILMEFLYKKFLSQWHPILLVFLFSIIGALLPLNLYGVIPIAAVLIACKIKSISIVAMISSNFIFNTSALIIKSNLVINHVTLTMLAAILVGIISGVVLRQLFKIKKFEPINQDLAVKILHKENKKFFNNLFKSIGFVGFYLIIGSLLQTLYEQRFDDLLLTLINSTSIGNKISGALVSQNVTVSPFAILIVSMLNSLLNFVNLSALFALLKIKGLFYTLFMLGLSFGTVIILAVIF